MRLERDRQGGLRAFAGAVKPSAVPQGWVATDSDESAEAPEPSDCERIDGGDCHREGDAAETAQVGEAPLAASVDVQPRAVETEAVEELDGADDQLAMFGVVRPDDQPAAKARRPTPRVAKARRRGRYTAATGTQSARSYRTSTEPIMNRHSWWLRRIPQKTSPFSKASSRSASAPDVHRRRRQHRPSPPGVGDSRQLDRRGDEWLRGQHLRHAAQGRRSSITIEDDGRGIPVDVHRRPRRGRSK